MHILLTDLLTCPRCGPGFGLIVLADRLEERLVVEGSLGCANCRATYPIDRGVVDLRRLELAPLDICDPADQEGGNDRIFRLAAATGTQPPGSFVLLISSSGEAAARMAELLAEARIVSVTPAPADALGEGDGGELGAADRVVTARALPFRNASFRAAALVGPVGEDLLAEVRRVLAPGGRIVVDLGSADTSERLARLGFEVHLDQSGTVVAAAPRPG